MRKFFKLKNAAHLNIKINELYERGKRVKTMSVIGIEMENVFKQHFDGFREIKTDKKFTGFVDIEHTNGVTKGSVQYSMKIFGAARKTNFASSLRNNMRRIKYRTILNNTDNGAKRYGVIATRLEEEERFIRLNIYRSRTVTRDDIISVIKKHCEGEGRKFSRYIDKEVEACVLRKLFGEPKPEVFIFWKEDKAILDVKDKIKNILINKNQKNTKELKKQ